ncbi:MAG: F0F1 ATP synthase subunit A [Flavobacteriaceae bacterium]|nr:F0F1 ATP synthase subunit A [Flavobacteriaceae bacterium]
MQRKKLLNLLTFLFLLVAFQANAQHDSHKAKQHDNKHAVVQHDNHGKELTLKEQIKADIDHHLLDAHDFHITNAITFPLPVILWDNGLQVFSSSKFNHGHDVAEHKGNYYKIAHSNGHIYKTDASGSITMNKKGFPDRANKPLDFSITKTVVMIFITGLLMLFLFGSLAKSYSKNNGIAKGPGRLLEPIILYIRDDIAIPNIGEKHYKKYMNYLLTIFFFIWFVNLFGLTPLGVNVTGNIAITLALALLTYLITTFSAKKDYWKHIFWMPGVPKPMRLILAPIELLGTVIKPFSLMIRLYANMKAGHVVLMSIIGLMFLFKSWIGSSLSFGLAFALMLLELLVAALQAYIFTMLSALYFG